MQVPHDVFSTQRIDEGTLLFLDNLSTTEPNSVLDMGCGYGALGLPIAKKYPHAKIDLVDRDLLAVEWATINAQTNEIYNVNAYGSLGYREVKLRGQKYDWILCNIPARIGAPFIENFFHEGLTLLNDHGDLRVVVIRDLVPLLNELKAKNQWALNEIAQGPRHSIFSLTKSEEALSAPSKNDEALYSRDRVHVGQLELDRPFDLGGDDQKRLKSGLPVLFDTLPRQDPHGNLKRILCFRAGYGQIPLNLSVRWPNAQVVAIDRDLLATEFTRLNAHRLKIFDSRLEIRENAHFPDAIAENETFDLVLGELSPSADVDVAIAELEAVERVLKPGREALILCLEKLERDWIKKFASRSKLGVYKVLSREGYSVIRLSS